MNPYEELRAEIVKRVPEIVELKFGCVLRDKSDLDTGDWFFIKRIANSDRVCIARESTGAGVGIIHDFKILGRPITLADILRATEPSAGTRLDLPGGYWEKRHNILALYDLTKSYDDQSDKFKTFLHSLLCSGEGE